jgi:methylthioribose-1-phosphate isomerase
MVVRGAPAIGVSAAYGLVLEMKKCPSEAAFAAACTSLAQARPTAVNLVQAVEWMRGALVHWDWRQSPKAFLEERAIAYHRADLAMNRAIGVAGAAFLPGRRRVLTHCNAGALATAGYGTALGIVRRLHEEGRLVRVFADETRPYLQGARLTQWECRQEGMPCTLVTDGMGGHLMSRGMVDCVIVGADRIAANGDVANKIGTFMLAMAAAYHSLPFVVAAPSTTLDPATPNGAAIPIEERPASEVLTLNGNPIAAGDTEVFNPAFDITPADLVTAIVTERGVHLPPFALIA